MDKILLFFKNNRMNISRVLIGGLVLLDLFTAPRLPIKSGQLIIIEFIAFLFILVATFGRLWALSYISGHKTQNLITDGPYSITRNPLYFFSFCGALGFGLISKSILVFCAIILAFAIYYPLVIRAEEKHLENVHHDSFKHYKSSVNAFFPNFFTFKASPTYPVDARRMRRAFFSVMWFPLMFFIMMTIDRLHALGFIPVFFQLA